MLHRLAARTSPHLVTSHKNPDPSKLRDCAATVALTAGSARRAWRIGLRRQRVPRARSLNSPGSLHLPAIGPLRKPCVNKPLKPGPGFSGSHSAALARGWPWRPALAHRPALWFTWPPGPAALRVALRPLFKFSQKLTLSKIQGPTRDCPPRATKPPRARSGSASLFAAARPATVAARSAQHASHPAAALRLFSKSVCLFFFVVVVLCFAAKSCRESTVAVELCDATTDRARAAPSRCRPAALAPTRPLARHRPWTRRRPPRCVLRAPGDVANAFAGDDQG